MIQPIRAQPRGTSTNESGAACLEVGDDQPGLTGLQPLVGPLDNLRLHHGTARAGVEPGEEGQGVGPHQLPDHGQGEGGVALLDVRTSNRKCIKGWGGGGEDNEPAMPTITRLSFLASSTA